MVRRIDLDLDLIFATAAITINNIIDSNLTFYSQWAVTKNMQRAKISPGRYVHQLWVYLKS
jgi:hypothetical protein